MAIGKKDRKRSRVRWEPERCCREESIHGTGHYEPGPSQNVALGGQLTRIRAHWMCRRRLRKFVKFGRGARDDGFATSAAISSYEIT